jgi:hypothetical protein
MLSLKTVCEKLKLYLQTKLDAETTPPWGSKVYVEFGKFDSSGQLAVNIPGVLIFVTPTKPEQRNYKNLPINRKANVSLFSVMSDSEHGQIAAVNAVTLMEYCEKHIADLEAYLNAVTPQLNPRKTQIFYTDESSVKLDAVFTDCATAVFEFEVNYATYFETT